MDGAGRRVDGFRAQDVGNGRDGDAPLGELAHIDRDAHLGRGSTPDLGLAYARDALDDVAEVAGRIFQRPDARRLAQEGYLHDVGQGGADLLDPQREKVGGELGAQGVELARDFVEFLVRVGGPLELCDDHSNAVAQRGVDALDVLKGIDDALKRIGDKLLHVGGSRSWKDRAHDDDGDGEARVFGARDLAHRTGTDDRQHQEDDQRELPVAYEERGETAHLRMAGGAGLSSSIATDCIIASI